ncbi:MAG: enoyl-CoA hydratase/isomerase family protein [Sandaracinaceae bacterium]
MDSPVWVEREGAVAIVAVDRPRTRNAIDREVHDALARALDEAEADEAVRALVVTGGGGTFVSGGDLGLIRDTPFEETLALCDRMTSLLDRFEQSPLPIVAAVEGSALGGGAELMIACDYRVAAPSSRISFRQAAMGVSTGWGATLRLSRVVPRGMASRLLLAAEMLDGPAAQRLGLVDEVADAPRARAIELGARFATYPRDVVAGLKRAIHAAYAEPPAAARAVERDVFASLWGGPAHRAALEAFFHRNDR